MTAQHEQYRALWMLIRDSAYYRVDRKGRVKKTWYTTETGEDVVNSLPLTTRDFMALAKIKGTRTAIQHLRAMRELGMITFEKKLARTIRALPEGEWR